MTSSDQKITRQRQSRIKQLPKPIKEQLDRLLREDRMSQVDILSEVNALCEQHGEDKLSRSSLGRYKRHADRMMKKTRELREVSSVWVSKLGEEPTSDVGKLLLQSIHTLAADVIMEMDQSGKVEPKALNQLALVMQRVEKAASDSLKREKAIRQAFAEEAANALTEELRGVDGISEDFEQRCRNVLLGRA